MKKVFQKNAAKIGIGVTLTGAFILANPIVCGVGVGMVAFSFRKHLPSFS